MLNPRTNKSSSSDCLAEFFIRSKCLPPNSILESQMLCKFFEVCAVLALCSWPSRSKVQALLSHDIQLQALSLDATHRR